MQREHCDRDGLKKSVSEPMKLLEKWNRHLVYSSGWVPNDGTCERIKNE